MRIMIYEPDVEGHRLHYVRNMIQGFGQFLKPDDIHVCLASDALQSAAYQTHLSDLSGSARVDPCLGRAPPGMLSGARHRAGSLQFAIERARPDWLLVPYADGLSQVMGAQRSLLLPTVPRRIVSQALLLRGGIAYPAASVKRRFFDRLSWWSARRAPWTHTYVLDPLVHALAPTMQVMPDPIELPDHHDARRARAELGLPTDGRFVSCVGAIDGRKGADLLIDAFSRAPLADSDRLLLAGPHHRDIRSLLEGPFSQWVRSGRIVSIDRTLHTSQLMTALVASDLVCALYPGHYGSASIVIRAAAARRPTLGHDFGWIRQTVPQFGLGWLTDARNAESLPAAVVTALDQSTVFKFGELAARFVEFHRIENFRAHWTANLRKALSLPADPNLRQWDWIAGPA
jgi:glycosyltransferase involved in cell wall biosynthesis